MRVLVFEWFYGGGAWKSDDSSDPKPLLESDFFRQGRDMIAAVAEDFAALGHQVILLEDSRLEHHPTRIKLANVESVPVSNGEAIKSTLVQQARKVDKILLIAPETDNLLLNCCRWVCGDANDCQKILNPNPTLIKLATDKHRTAKWLGGRGVNVPQGCLLSEFNPARTRLKLPVMIKPVDGAGCDDVLYLNNWPKVDHAIKSLSPMSPKGSPPKGPPKGPDPMGIDAMLKNSDRYRIEEFISGVSVSVSVIGNKDGYFFLPATEQIFETPGRNFAEVFSWGAYRGARFPPGDPQLFDPIQQAELGKRAYQLAQQAVRVLPQTNGYFGIDMVLSDRGVSFDGVIEINPRLTVSYTKLREILGENLAEKMF